MFWHKLTSNYCRNIVNSNQENSCRISAFMTRAEKLWRFKGDELGLDSTDPILCEGFSNFKNETRYVIEVTHGFSLSKLQTSIALTWNSKECLDVFQGTLQAAIIALTACIPAFLGFNHKLKAVGCWTKSDNTDCSSLATTIKLRLIFMEAPVAAAWGKPELRYHRIIAVKVSTFLSSNFKENLELYNSKAQLI